MLKYLNLQTWLVSSGLSYSTFRVVRKIILSAQAYEWGGNGTS